MNVIPLTLEEFVKNVVDVIDHPHEWKYLGDLPCLIEFSATWSEHYKEMTTVLNQLSFEFANRVYIYRVDIDEEEDLLTAFDIEQVPTLLFCPMNEPPQKALGLFDRETLRKGINEILLQTV